MKKKSLAITFASFLALGAIMNYSPIDVFATTTFSSSDVNQTQTFSDVPKTHWAYEEIQSLKDRGIAEAYIGNSFMPDLVLTREAAARLLVKAKGLSIKEPSLDSISYKDISANDENLKYIQAATKAGIFSGYPDGTFKPKEPLTRTQMAVVLVKTFGLTVTNSDYVIADMKPEHWAYKYVQTLAAYEIERGIYYVPGNMSTSLIYFFRPKASNTRAHMAIFVSHALKITVNDTLFENIYKNDIEAVKNLLQNGANPNGYASLPTLRKYYSDTARISDSRDIKMLYPAIINKNYEMIQLLIDYGVKVDDNIYFGRRDLQHAIDNGDYKLAELLLKTNKIDQDGLSYFDGRSYLAYAITKNQTEIAKLLVKYGYAPYKKFSPHFSSNQNPAWKGYSNPYEYAVGLNRTELVTYFQSWSWKNEYQSQNVDITKIKLPKSEFQTREEIYKFLNDNFSYLYTPVGKTEFTFLVMDSYRASDYWITTWFDKSFFNDIGKLAPNKYYDTSTREEVKRLLKEHQEKIGTILSQINNNSKLYGGYFYPPPMEVGPNNIMSVSENKVNNDELHYFSWKNYDENSTDRYFRWYPLEDDEL
jgi:ankyrin repeat protein